MSKYQDLADSVFRGDAEKCGKLTLSLIDGGKSPVEILNEGLYVGMELVGEKFKAGEMFIPEVLRAANAMHEAMSALKPLLTEREEISKGTVVLGTVQGDLHDIGKNLVCMMLEGGGFNVVDIGVDIPAEKFVEEVKKNKAKVLGMSTLLTMTMPSMDEVVKAVRADKEIKDVKIMIGGAPVTRQYADSIGADGYAPDATGAVDVANELC
jgi:corrinoid protein of di/trimethylamine methyltransferase